MASEIASAVWRKARAGEIERRAAGILLANMPDMPMRWNDDETVSADAVRLALALDHPAYASGIPGLRSIAWGIATFAIVTMTLGFVLTAFNCPVAH